MDCQSKCKLVSSSKDEIIDQMLEEQDVGTIKIIYDQD